MDAGTFVAALLVAGALLIFIGWIWSIISTRGMNKADVWRVGMYFFAIIVIPIYLVKHWDRAKKAGICFVTGLVLLGLGILLALLLK